MRRWFEQQMAGAQITHARHGGAQVLAVHGDLDVASAEELRRSFEGLPPGREPMVVDLSDCPFVDSRGLQALLQIWRECWGTERPMATAASGLAAQVLLATGVERTVSLRPDLATALAGLGG